MHSYASPALPALTRESIVLVAGSNILHPVNHDHEAIHYHPALSLHLRACACHHSLRGFDTFICSGNGLLVLHSLPMQPCRVLLGAPDYARPLFEHKPSDRHHVLLQRCSRGMRPHNWPLTRLLDTSSESQPQDKDRRCRDSRNWLRVRFHYRDFVE